MAYLEWTQYRVVVTLSDQVLYWLGLLTLVCVTLWALMVPPGGQAWASTSWWLRRSTLIPGPKGLPVLGSLHCMGCLAHRTLSDLAGRHGARPLMALSLGGTRLVVSTLPDTAHAILTNPAFASRPIKTSAESLLFNRALGFAPYGPYWRKLRRLAAIYLFSPASLRHHAITRSKEINALVDAVTAVSASAEGVELRPLLQKASLSSVMRAVLGSGYDIDGDDRTAKLQEMVREGFELLGAFNMADHLPSVFDYHGMKSRCGRLLPDITAFFSKVLEERRRFGRTSDGQSDFVDALLQEESLDDGDVIAILWEMIFRGTDSVAIVIEWALAEMVLNPSIQTKLRADILDVVGNQGRHLEDGDLAALPYLQAVVSETLRRHPPGPLLSWARLATQDTKIHGHHIPAGTTAMVNMWAIAHDPSIWPDPLVFRPERFLDGHVVDIRGSDLRLAPFGAGRRVCPGRILGLATVGLWLGRLVQSFEFESHPRQSVDLSERLLLSCQMAQPLRIRVRVQQN